MDSVDRESLYATRRPPWERLARHRQYEAHILDDAVATRVDRQLREQRFPTKEGESPLAGDP